MTYTVVARGRGGLLGVATASRSLAVGSSVPAVVPGLAVVASQAYTDRALRGAALDGLRAGASPRAVLAGLAAADDGLATRQLALVDSHGRVATHTGESCTAWAGSIEGGGFAVVGNLLAGAGVIDAMAACMTSATRAARSEDGPAAFASHLLACLRAGEAAGGDARGQQSAALLVAGDSAPGRLPAETEVDLRVDDHRAPLHELARLLALRYDR